ncbi:winged helix-turn-helix transcriptional regulator [Nocardia abscessus]|uniref:winged helix-turn-helix domain-containing protein n=1 Tax=Nocardia abscessus TaxID=120957 RepID=UPI0018948688|nr:winged helix-turn-helix domain-containing protein [Nocardia abscessus]MBF6339852.1 winged helix-turn-helix transcriptional regulator [Nocardia abscessus]
MTLPLDGPHADRSAALFNNRHLVTVVHAISSGQVTPKFTNRQIAGATGLPDSVVRPILRRLRDAGVITPVVDHMTGARGAKYFQAVANTTAWTSLTELCRALTDGSLEPDRADDEISDSHGGSSESDYPGRRDRRDRQQPGRQPRPNPAPQAGQGVGPPGVLVSTTSRSPSSTTAPTTSADNPESTTPDGDITSHAEA